MAEEITLQGEYSRDTLPSLIQYLAMLGSSGELWLTASPQQAATLAFLEGRLIGAHHGNYRGEDALYRILNFSAGQFRFHPGTITIAPSITAPLEKLLLDAAYWQDTQSDAEVLPGPDAVPNVIPDENHGELRLELMHWRVMSLADGQRSLYEIAANLGRNIEEVREIAHQLATRGILTFGARTRATVDPAFLEELRRRLTTLIGPIARVIVNDAAQQFGTPADQLEPTQVRAFLEVLTQLLAPAKQARFRELAAPLIDRFAR
ncbi:hypothetical protein HNR42_000579 [Deinobacterium chartae]|uniref:DUF4388 domain-containing protein n=1 Tax=Deinobacterium chartae TaxID=521158 RepID=A0A841HZK3_9DEIO|nr:DUF4388 domain-containing protein [Deinobacterium chartae]MBB6097165.1 hypothetical protein [Deinobacterium chartae]